LILETGGSGKQRRGIIKISPDERHYLVFNISPDGLLSALLADEYTVKLVWWRTDKLAAL